jgi:hypothetical protein
MFEITLKNLKNTFNTKKKKKEKKKSCARQNFRPLWVKNLKSLILPFCFKKVQNYVFEKV